MPRGKVILAQVDHVSGETLGFALDRLFELGAKNVQLLQSMTKKNRPGYLLFIDLPPDKLEPIAFFLAKELGIWGYHLMETEHVHFEITMHKRRLRLLEDSSNRGEMTFNVKYIADKGSLLSIKIEHDFLVDLQKKLEAMGYFFSTRTLRATLEAMLWSAPSAEEIISLKLKELQQWEPFHHPVSAE